MRKLKIETKQKQFAALTNIPEEFMFVESIARRFANDFTELEELYAVGLVAANAFQTKCIDAGSNAYDISVVWVVRQDILRYLREKGEINSDD